MTEIQRFERDMDGYMEPSEDGQWVRYDDYCAALRAQADARPVGMRVTPSLDHPWVYFGADDRNETFSKLGWIVEFLYTHPAAEATQVGLNEDDLANAIADAAIRYANGHTTDFREVASAILSHTSAKTEEQTLEGGDKAEERSSIVAEPWAAERPIAQSPCKGMNCGCTDSVSHSAECFAEHVATVLLSGLIIRNKQLGEGSGDACRREGWNDAVKACIERFARQAALTQKQENNHVQP